MQTLHYSALERLAVQKPVDRVDFIASIAHGKRVFDLGALDETAVDAKQDTDNWLHARLCNVGEEVVGVDNSTLVPEGGLQTASNGRIIKGDIFRLNEVVSAWWKPDIVVAGELLEHLPDTHAFLASLRNAEGLRGAKFVFSTPNACAWHNALIGIFGRESMHRDHLQIYSYKTLRTLFERAGVELQELRPYHARFPEMVASSKGIRRIGVTGFEKLVNGLESFSPMMSAGWIGVATL